MTKRVYDTGEVSEALGIGKTKAYTLMKSPDFPAIRLGKTFIVPVDAFERWLAEQTQKSASDKGVQGCC